MSGANPFPLVDEDLTKILAATAHLGSQNLNFQMEQYVFKRTRARTCLFNVRKMWDKLVLAARAVAAIENPADVCIISARQIGQRAVLKYARYTGATPIAGRFTPGSFTNQIQQAFKEPRLIIILDPIADHQPITEASYCNIPVIAFATSDNPMRYVDITIPCNNRGPQSIGLMVWFLAREVLRIRGEIPRSEPWSVMADMFFYRKAEEAVKEEQQVAEPAETYEAQPGADLGEWTDNTTIGQNVQLQTGYAADENWSAADEGWNKQATQDSWNAAATSWAQ